MTTAIAKAEVFESVLLQGDLSKLAPPERVAYYKSVCDSLGLNPLTKPFEFLTLNGKLLLYARRDCTEQLRKRDQISVKIIAREVVEGMYVVTANASAPSGRTDESIGAVPIDKLQGESRANAMMKAETKAKRRVTLAICGLGILDESETDGLPGAAVVPVSQPQPAPVSLVAQIAALPATPPEPAKTNPVLDAFVESARDAYKAATNYAELRAAWEKQTPEVQALTRADKDIRKFQLNGKPSTGCK